MRIYKPGVKNVNTIPKAFEKNFSESGYIRELETAAMGYLANKTDRHAPRLRGYWIYVLFYLKTCRDQKPN